MIDLSSRIIKKFNGYEIMKKKSEIQRKKSILSLQMTVPLSVFLRTVSISIQSVHRQKHEVDCRL